MSMECCVPNDSMWQWKITLRTIVHSSRATLEVIMVVTKGVRAIIEATNGCATIVMIQKELNTTFNDVLAIDVHDANTPFGGRLRIAMVVLEDEWIAIHCMPINNTNRLHVDIRGIDAHPNLEVVIHMGEATLINSSKIAFGGYTWRVRVVNLRTIFQYPKVILANT